MEVFKIRFCSFDQCTNNVPFAIFDNKELIKYGTFEVSDISDVTERINTLKYLIDKLIQEYNIEMAYFEGIQLQHGNVKAYNPLARLQGVLLDYCFENEMPHDIIPPIAWKSRVGIDTKKKREAQKKQSIEIVKHRFGIDVDDGIADAINLGYSQINK